MAGDPLHIMLARQPTTHEEEPFALGPSRDPQSEHGPGSVPKAIHVEPKFLVTNGPLRNGEVIIRNGAAERAAFVPGLDVDTYFYAEMAQLKFRWTQLEEHGRCEQLARVLNQQLTTKYRAFPVKIVRGKGSRGFDPHKWEISMGIRMLDPTAVETWKEAIYRLAYEGEKVRQYWQILHYILKFEPAAARAYPSDVVKAAQKEPDLSPEEYVRAGRMLQSIRSAKSIQAKLQVDVAAANLETAMAKVYRATGAPVAFSRFNAEVEIAQYLLSYLAELRLYRDRPEEQAAHDAGTRAVQQIRRHGGQ